MLRRAAIPGLWAALSNHAPGVTVPRSLASTIDRLIQARSGFHGLLVRKDHDLDEDSVVRHGHFVKNLEKVRPMLAPLKEVWAGHRNGTYDLVDVSDMTNTAVDFLRAVEAKVEAVYREHGEGNGMIGQIRTKTATFPATTLSARYDHYSGRLRSEKDEYESTEENKAILHGVFQELVFKAQIADDTVEDELSRGFRLFIDPTSKGMQFWLVCNPTPGLIRGNIQVNLNVRQPYLYRRETLGTVRDTIDERSFGDPLATMLEQALRAAQEPPGLLRPPAALATEGLVARRWEDMDVLIALQGADTFFVAGEPPRRGYQEMLLLSYGYSPEVHQHAQESRGRGGQAHDGEYEEAQGAGIHPPHLAGAIPVGPHPPEGRRHGQDRRAQHEEHEGHQRVVGPGDGVGLPAAAAATAAAVRAAELLQKLLVALDAETAGHAYFSVGIPLLDVVSDNTTFCLDNHDPVTRAVRERATVAAVEGLLGRGA
ncbi:hypothetical protein DL768_006605 [Monosporascus sp. mg162]|nr:hypothetical protein DL768_006605 [Monosporascus sp. mg162]